MELKDLAFLSVGGITAGLAILKYVSEWNEENIVQIDRFKTALRSELDLISGWANPFPDSSFEDYMVRPEFNSFWYPSRVIFEFDYPTIKNLLNSRCINLLGNDIAETSIQLLQSIENFYQYHREYRKFVLLYPNFYLEYGSMKELSKVKVDQIRIEEEKRYIEKVFRYNYTLHHNLIGNKDTQIGLYYWHNELSKKLKKLNPRNDYKIIALRNLSYIFIGIGLISLIGFTLREFIIILNKTLFYLYK